MSESYFLKVGESGYSRLQILNEIYNPYSQRFINSIGISKGMNILDVGCGTGDMTFWFSDLVGTCGHVIGLDSSKAQIDLCLANSLREKYRNVEFCINSINNNDIQNIIGIQFDLIYCRFVLMHSSDVISCLTNMKNLLKPNGVLVCEEPIMDDVFCTPNSLDFYKYRNLLNQLAIIKNKEFNIGDQMETLLYQVGFSDISISNVQPVVRDAERKHIMPLSVIECQDQYQHYGLITKSDTDALLDELYKLVHDENFHIGCPKLIQSCAFKR